MFTHIHWHSQFSLLEAIGSSKSIINRLKELGFSHAPITDYNGMYNVIAHYEICKKEQMTPILGVDLAIQLQMQWKSVTQSRYITLIAKNYDGYMTLLDIISHAHTDQGHTVPHLHLSHFPETGGNIIALINCYETPIGDMINHGRTEEEIIQTLTTYQELFGKEQVFLEIIPQDPELNAPLANANKSLRDFHEKTQIPVLVSSNFHYIYKEDKEAYDIARCIKDGKRIYDDDRRKTFGDFYITSTEEIENHCKKNGFTETQIETMFKTSSNIGDMISMEIPLNDILFPIYESPDDIKELYSKFPQQIAG